MRLFVAVVPPLEVRREALREAGSLPWGGRIRWLQPENLHLTLKFLGETPESEIGGLHGALEAVCSRHRVFDLDLREVGAFPTTKKARVLWVGIGEGSKGLRALAGDVEDALESLGFGREKRSFHPHATVGRARDGEAWLETSERDREVGPLPFRAESVELLESRLSREGAVYSTVASYSLGG